MSLRAGMQRLRAYNDGLSVFLYDGGHVARIKKGAPNYWAGKGTRTRRDDELKALAADGTLVVYELPQDDSLDVGVIVGPPLTAKELAGVQWRPPQTALIDLPSGKLFVDSWNTLRAHPLEKPADKGATAKVPPGRYALSLHRVDWMVDQSYDGPREIVVLTPTKQAKLTEPPPMLEAVAGEPKPEVEVGRVLDGRWQGKVISVDESKRGPSIALDLSEDHAEALGLLKGGQRLVLTVGGREYPVFNQGSLRSAMTYESFFSAEQIAALKRDPGVHSYCESEGIPLADKVPGHEHWLRVAAFEGGSQVRSDLFSTAVGAPASLRVEGPPFIAVSKLPPAKFKAGVLTAVTLASTPTALTVHADYTALRKLKLEREQRLEVEIDGNKYEAAEKRDAWRILIDQMPDENVDALERAEKKRDTKRGKVSDAELEPFLERIDSLRFAPGVLEARPMKYEFRPTWADPEECALTLTPLYQPESKKARYAMPQVAPGTTVLLRKRE